MLIFSTCDETLRQEMVGTSKRSDGMEKVGLEDNKTTQRYKKYQIYITFQIKSRCKGHVYNHEEWLPNWEPSIHS